jgi:hypothetical protein
MHPNRKLTYLSSIVPLKILHCSFTLKKIEIYFDLLHLFYMDHRTVKILLV